MYTKTAEFAFERDRFLLVTWSGEDPTERHHRFLGRRISLPLHHSWQDWLWQRGLDSGEIVPLESNGILAYCCNPKGEELKADLYEAVAAGTLTLPDPRVEDPEGSNNG